MRFIDSAALEGRALFVRGEYRIIYRAAGLFLIALGFNCNIVSRAKTTIRKRAVIGMTSKRQNVFTPIPGVLIFALNTSKCVRVEALYKRF